MNYPLEMRNFKMNISNEMINSLLQQQKQTNNTEFIKSDIVTHIPTNTKWQLKLTLHKNEKANENETIQKQQQWLGYYLYFIEKPANIDNMQTFCCVSIKNGNNPKVSHLQGSRAIFKKSEKCFGWPRFIEIETLDEKIFGNLKIECHILINTINDQPLHLFSMFQQISTNLCNVVLISFLFFYVFFSFVKKTK